MRPAALPLQTRASFLCGQVVRGFTLIEMVIVMALIGLLLALALPRFIATLERGKEQALRHNLVQMREALDKYYGDNGKYPDRLEDLVTRRYLRAIPLDPFTETATWVVIAPEDSAMGGVMDVQSTMTNLDGQPRSNPETGAQHLPGMAAREGGSAQTLTITPNAEPNE